MADIAAQQGRASWLMVESQSDHDKASIVADNASHLGF